MVEGELEIPVLSSAKGILFRLGKRPYVYIGAVANLWNACGTRASHVPTEKLASTG